MSSSRPWRRSSGGSRMMLPRAPLHAGHRLDRLHSIAALIWYCSQFLYTVVAQVTSALVRVLRHCWQFPCNAVVQVAQALGWASALVGASRNAGRPCYFRRRLPIYRSMRSPRRAGMGIPAGSDAGLGRWWPMWLDLVGGTTVTNWEREGRQRARVSCARLPTAEQGRS